MMLINAGSSVCLCIILHLLSAAGSECMDGIDMQVSIVYYISLLYKMPILTGTHWLTYAMYDTCKNFVDI
jgi:hypothetical protein